MRSPAWSWSVPTATASVSGATSSSSHVAHSTPRFCCCARRVISIRTGSPTLPASSAGITWRTQFGRDRDLEGAEPNEVPEDPRTQRLLLGRRRLRPSSWAHPDAREDRRPDTEGRRTAGRAGFALDYVARHAVDFWLTTEDLPHPGNRVTLGRNGRIELRYSNTNLEPHRRLVAKLKGLLSRLDMHPRFIPRHLIRDERVPIAGVAHQCGNRPLRERPDHVRARRELQGPRPGQPLRGRHGFFPSSSAVNSADGDRERAARRRPPAQRLGAGHGRELVGAPP